MRLSLTPSVKRVNRALIYINRKSNGAPTAVSGDLDKKSSLEIKMVNSRNWKLIRNLSEQTGANTNNLVESGTYWQ
jgi:hypothetical protein